MKNFLTLALALTVLSSCGRGKQGKSGDSGSTVFGVDAVSTGVELEDITNGLVCSAGGVKISTFFDLNANGSFDVGENVIKIKSLCNGIDGADGTSSTLSMEGFTSSSQCASGGVKISSSTQDSFEVCNGANGINGQRGLQGEQGIPGIAGSNGQAGADGTIVTPVKFCSSDNSTYPEYGLLFGSELFAVYWGTTPASPSASQAFLAKLTPGQYRSTGGNNCIFLVN